MFHLIDKQQGKCRARATVVACVSAHEKYTYLYDINIIFI